MLRYSDHHAQVHQPYQVPLSSHSNISRKNNFLEISKKHRQTLLSFDFIVERITNLFSGITNKDIHLILVVNSFTYAMHTKNLRKDYKGLYPCHDSYGVISTDYDDALFSVKAVVSKA